MINLLANSMYGLKHLLMLAFSLLIIIFGAIFGPKLSMKKIIKILLIVGIISELIKVFYFIHINQSVFTYNNGKEVNIGLLPKTDLPFHLCSIQIIFIIILNLSSNEKIKKILLAFMIPTCLVGGIAALLLPTNSSLNGMFILTIQYFSYHAILVAFAIYLYKQKEVEFTFKDYINTLIMLGAIGMFAIYLNGIIANGEKDINFMYVVHAPNADSLTLPYLNTNDGWIPYILRYALLAILVITLCYIKPIIIYIKEKLNKKKEVEKLSTSSE